MTSTILLLLFPTIKPILFIFGFSAFLLDLFFAGFFFKKYLKTQKQHKFLLFASLALFFMYWVRLPFVFSLIGFSFVIEYFYLFFAICLPSYVLALICLILVFYYSTCPRLCQKRLHIIFGAWTIVAFLSLGYYFVNYKGLFEDYTPMKTLYYVFIFPVRILILLVISRSFFLKEVLLTKLQKIGILILLLNNLTGAVVNYFNYSLIMRVPPSFWFLPVTGYSIAFVWEFINSILLIVGFYLFAKDFWKK